MRRFPSRLRLAAILVALALPTPARPQTADLTEIASYGWAESSDADRPITDRERRFEGAVLGSPADVVQGPDGSVYVLDRSFLKIVVFDADGAFQRLIVGGAGQGPGEFTRPRAMSVGPDGSVWVWDQLAARVTRFDATGEVGEVHALGSAQVIDFQAAGDRLYGTRIVRDSADLVVHYDPGGRFLGTLAPPDAAVVAVLGSQGAVAALGQGGDGTVLVAYPAVGTWARIRGSHVGPRQGRVLFPDARPVDYTDPRYGVTIQRQMAEAQGIGVLSDGRVFVFYTRREEVDDRPWGKVALFGPDGAYIRTLDRRLDSRVLGAAVDEPALFLYAEDPYPRVVKVRVR